MRPRPSPRSEPTMELAAIAAVHATHRKIFAVADGPHAVLARYFTMCSLTPERVPAAMQSGHALVLAKWRMSLSESRSPPFRDMRQVFTARSLNYRRSCSREWLFAQIFERHRDAVVIELLVIAAKVAAAIGPAMKILRHHTDWRVRLAFESGRAANVDRAVEIEIVDIVVEIADQQSGHWLIADAQHRGARANWSYVLVAPSDFVIETQASDGCAVGIEINPLGPRGVVVQVLWKRHFHTSNHIDDHAHLLSLGPLRRAKTHHQSRRKRESPDRMGHLRESFLDKRGTPTDAMPRLRSRSGERNPNTSVCCEFPFAGAAAPLLHRKQLAVSPRPHHALCRHDDFVTVQHFQDFPIEKI